MVNPEAAIADPMPMQIELSELFLDSENPRHKPVDDEPQAIRSLCENEKVFELAEDIAKYGLNPLERFAVIPSQGSSAAGPFIVVEGNRRLCALKLLADPDSAPTGEADKFRALSTVRKINKIEAMIFADKSSARIWLERQHSGEFEGRGRKPWNAEQKSRFLGGGRHGRAQRILDFAEAKGWITEEERVGKLSIVDRWISNPIFRETLGLEFTKGSDDPHRTRPQADFDFMIKLFIDLVRQSDTEAGISTRAKAEDMKRKAREIEDKVLPEIAARRFDGRRIESEPVLVEPEAPAAPLPPSPAPKRPRYTRLPHSAKIEAALEDLGVQKLQKLYHSLVKVLISTQN